MGWESLDPGTDPKRHLWLWDCEYFAINTYGTCLFFNCTGVSQPEPAWGQGHSPLVLSPPKGRSQLLTFGLINTVVIVPPHFIFEGPLSSQITSVSSKCPSRPIWHKHLDYRNFQSCKRFRLCASGMYLNGKYHSHFYIDSVFEWSLARTFYLSHCSNICT